MTELIEIKTKEKAYELLNKYFDRFHDSRCEDGKPNTDAVYNFMGNIASETCYDIGRIIYDDAGVETGFDYDVKKMCGKIFMFTWWPMFEKESGAHRRMSW